MEGLTPGEDRVNSLWRRFLRHWVEPAASSVNRQHGCVTCISVSRLGPALRKEGGERRGRWREESVPPPEPARKYC